MNEQYDEYNEVIKQLEDKCAELERQVVAMAIELSSKEGAIEIKDRLIAAQQQQIAVYRDFVIGVRDDVLYQLANYPDIPISLKELGITCEAFGQQTYNLLAQPYDTSALEKYKDEVLDMVLRLESPDEYDYMVVLSSDIRRMKKG